MSRSIGYITKNSSFKFWIIGLAVLNSFSNCRQALDKSYFKQVSKIDLPAKYEVLESFDNGEFLTGILIETDSLHLKEFLDINHFEALNSKSIYNLSLVDNSYFKHRPPDYRNSVQYILRGTNDKASFIFLADLPTKRIWGVINYPDWSGH